MQAKIRWKNNSKNETTCLKAVSEIRERLSSENAINPKNLDDFDSKKVYNILNNCNANCLDNYHDHEIYSEGYIVKLIGMYLLHNFYHR